MGEYVVTRTHASEVRLLICRLSNPYQDPSSSEPFLFLFKTLNLFQNNRVNSLFLLFLSLQFKFSVHPCILFCLLAFPPHPFPYFLISGYLLRNPDNSNFFFDFPRRFELSPGSYLPCTQTSLSRWKRARKGRREGVCTLPMVPCGSSSVARHYLAKNEVPEEEAG